MSTKKTAFVTEFNNLYRVRISENPFVLFDTTGKVWETPHRDEADAVCGGYLLEAPVQFNESGRLELCSAV